MPVGGIKLMAGVASRIHHNLHGHWALGLRHGHSVGLAGEAEWNQWSGRGPISP
jgi:hypothetical protein